MTDDMGERTDVAPCPRSGSPSSRGFSYVEVLVAIVLVGVTVIAAIVGLRATVSAGRIGTERSQLLLWVQEGAQAVHRMPYVPCSPVGTMTNPQVDSIQSSYQATLDTLVPPGGMTGGTLLVTDIDFLSTDPVKFVDRWHHNECDPSFEVTLLRISATSPQNTTIDVEVIVDG